MRNVVRAASTTRRYRQRWQRLSGNGVVVGIVVGVIREPSPAFPTVDHAPDKAPA
jgi:hypothetical protein